LWEIHATGEPLKHPAHIVTLGSWPHDPLALRHHLPCLPQFLLMLAASHKGHIHNLPFKAAKRPGGAPSKQLQNMLNDEGQLR